MVYYHLKIYYWLSTKLTKLFRASGIRVFDRYFDLSIEEVEEIKIAKEENRSFQVRQKRFDPESLISVNVYRTKKSTKEYSAESDMRISEVEERIVNGRIGKDVTSQFFPLSVIAEGTQRIDDLMNAAEFLGLDENWFVATCSLQLQEIMIVKLAEKKGVVLDKGRIKEILNKTDEELFESSDYIPFRERYKAFSKEAKHLWGIDMPAMPLAFREMRSQVLHNGCNPTVEDTNFLVDYTTEMLRRLNESFKNIE